MTAPVIESPPESLDKLNQVLDNAMRQIMRPKPKITGSEWANKYRVLSAETATSPGPYNWKRAPYQKEWLDTMCDDHTQKVVLMTAARVGKALDTTTPIRTTSGWSTMADLHVGDVIFDMDGKPTTVTFKSDVMHDRPCYRVQFSNNTSLVADADHQWVVGCIGSQDLHTMTTQDILDYGLFDNRGRRHFYIPVSGALSIDTDVDLLIDPYVMGAWLGDGHSNSNRISSSKRDVYHIAAKIEVAGYRVAVSSVNSAASPNGMSIQIDTSREGLCQRGHPRERNGGSCLQCAHDRYHIPDMRERQTFGRQISVLGVRRNKHIPAIYQNASTSQRLALLQGLMDTDGYVAKNGRCQWYSTSQRLTDDVYALMRGLGIKVSITRKQNVNCNILTFTAPQLPVVTLPFKVERLSKSSTRLNQCHMVRIVDIVPTPSVPVQCIQVDSLTSTYLAGRDLIPTHNTTVMENATGFFMHQNPAAIMWLLPTLGIAEQFSATSLDPMIRDCRELRALVKDKRRRDSGNLKFQKRYKGGQLALVGAESPAQLHGKTIRVLFADEVDRFPFSSGGDGDPLTLASVRTATFGSRRKIVISSTPSYKDLSHIEREFLASDQRYYHVPCPDCGHYQKLIWKNLNYSDDMEHPHYVCVSCGVLIPESQKFNMLLKGKWIAENPESNVAGFHISALYSVYVSWTEMVHEWKQCKTNRFKFQVFINSMLGETYDEAGDRVTAHQLERRMEKYNAQCPTKEEGVCNGVGLITAGVDVQGNRLELAVYGYGANDEIYLIDTEIVDGDTATDAPWNKLTQILFTKRYKTLSGATVGIRSVAIDSGYQTERVYRYVAHLRNTDMAGRTFIATKGNENFPRLIADRPSQSTTANALFYVIGTNLAKEHLSKLMANATPGPSYLHIPIALPTNDAQPRWTDREILAQLTSEKPTTKYKAGRPKRVWVKSRERNEQWDMMILAYAALIHLGSNVLKDLEGLAQKVADLQPTDALANPTTSVKPTGKPQSGLERTGLRINQPLGNNRNFWGR